MTIETGFIPAPTEPLDIEVPLNLVKEPDPKVYEALQTRPRRVAILALGPSIKDYVNESARKKGLFRVDETWGVNTSHRSFKCDKIWVMDDLKKVAHNYPDWSNELKLEKTPIITCIQNDDFPSSVPFPLEEVCNEFKDDYFSTTVAYMIAYAAYIRVEELLLFGVDFYYPNAIIVESGSAGVAYWLGIAKSRGVHYKIPGSSTLLDANMITVSGDPNKPEVKRLLYGYDYNPQDAQRRTEQGNATEAEELASTRAYRPTDPDDPEVIEKLGLKPKLETK